MPAARTGAPGTKRLPAASSKPPVSFSPSKLSEKVTTRLNICLFLDDLLSFYFKRGIAMIEFVFDGVESGVLKRVLRQTTGVTKM